jgi:hypothetical protein
MSNQTLGDLVLAELRSLKLRSNRLSYVSSVYSVSQLVLERWTDDPAGISAAFAKHVAEVSFARSLHVSMDLFAKSHTTQRRITPPRT